MGVSKLQSRVIEAEDFDEINNLFYDKGWTDGLPVVPPTEERVKKMLDFVGRDPDEIIGDVPNGYGVATIEKIAINAVMAGCLPSYMPVVVAAVEAICEPIFNLDGIQGTTNPTTAGIIINGPIRKELDINSGRNCLGQGWRANATLGRTVRLIMINIGHGRPGISDQAIHGWPGKYSLCFAEDEEGSAWDPFHVDQGFKREDSTVTAASIHSTVNIGCSNLLDIQGMLAWIAGALGYSGHTNMTSGRGRPVLALTSGHSHMAAEAGMSKTDVCRFIYERTGFPASSMPPMVRTGRMPIFDGIVKPAQRAEDIMIIVTGGPDTYHAVFMPTFAAAPPVTKLIRTKSQRSLDITKVRRKSWSTR